MQAGQPSRQSARGRVGALTPRQSAALTVSVEPAVYCVPEYWLGSSDITPWATVVHAVEGAAAVAIYATTTDGEVELDFGPAIMRFPADSAAQWLVHDATHAAALRLTWAEARDRPAEGDADEARPREEARAAGSVTQQQATHRAVSAQRPTATRRGGKGGRGRRPPPRVQPQKEVGGPVREPLVLTLPTPVVAPANIIGEAKKWVTENADALRAWVADALEGNGLTRHVPTPERPLPANDVRDSFHASTTGLLAELSAALRRFVGSASRSRRLRHKAALSQVPGADERARPVPRDASRAAAPHFGEALVDHGPSPPCGRCLARGAR